MKIKKHEIMDKQFVMFVGPENTLFSINIYDIKSLKEVSYLGDKATLITTNDGDSYYTVKSLMSLTDTINDFINKKIKL